MNKQHPLPQVSASDCNPVPVFNCQVIMGPPDDNGRREGRVANLAGITASGYSERDVLTAIAKTFKATVKSHVDNGTDIPFIDPPETPGPGEAQRFLPVHL